MKYMIEFNNVAYELALYYEEMQMYGEVLHFSESFPMYIWIESMWDQDIIESAYGVKKVYPHRGKSAPLSVEHDRNWTELLGTKWEAKPE